MIARFFSWVTERQFDDDTPDPDYDPAAVTEPWLGHWDGCCVAYSDICDCDPDNPVNLAEQEADET